VDSGANNKSEPINNEDQVAIIGNKFDIKGDLNGVGAAIISGKIEGNISANQVVIEHGGSVVGNITCQQIDISGHVYGLIEAIDVVIREKGVIENGDLNYTTLAIESGGVVTGRLKQQSVDVVPNNIQPLRAETKKQMSIAFSGDLEGVLHSKELRRQARLSLLDGSAPPYWVCLSLEEPCLIVNVPEYEQLKESGLKLGLRLQVGIKNFELSLPS
jgi:cytoskeletal protein CcmA (bactofilin family)